MKVDLQTVAKVIVTLAAFIILFLVLRGVNVGLALRILISANPFALVAVIFLQAVSITLRLVRWKYMLLPAQEVPLRTLVTPLLVSFAVGNLTMTWVGAVPRIYLLNRQTGINPGFIAGTLAHLQASAIMAFTEVIIGLPSLPGFVGTLEAATASLVVALGGARESALAYALLLHVIIVVPTTLAGALLAWHAGLRIVR